MKILAIDDHPLIQEALRQVLRELDKNVRVIAALQRDEALLQAARHPDCTLILLDLTLPGASGMSLLAQLRARYPAIPVVVHSATCDRATVLAAIDQGAMGFIPKTSSASALIVSLRRVLSGEIALPPGLSGDPVADAAGVPMLGLSPRQLQVLTLMVQGLPNKLICRRLELAEGTVKVHVSAVLKSLKVENRTQAVIALSRLGIRLDAFASAA